MFLTDYTPFLYVGIIALFSIFVAYYSSDIFLKFGGTKRFWFYIILFFNVYFFLFANLAMLSQKHRVKLSSKDRIKSLWILICYAVLIAIPIVVAILIGTDPIF